MNFMHGHVTSSGTSAAQVAPKPDLCSEEAGTVAKKRPALVSVHGMRMVKRTLCFTLQVHPAVDSGYSRAYDSP